jgi:hypothetical protein
MSLCVDAPFQAALEAHFPKVLVDLVIQHLAQSVGDVLSCDVHFWYTRWCFDKRSRIPLQLPKPFVVKAVHWRPETSIAVYTMHSAQCPEEVFQATASDDFTCFFECPYNK